MSLKLAINNEIISMRDNIRQAKVHIINKLTKEIKLLRNKKGTEQQIEKNKRKADRLVEEIIILKKNKPDDVTRFILAQEDIKKLIERPTSSEKDKIFAKIGMHKSVVPKIKVIKEKYPGPLDEFLTPGKKRQIKLHRKELKQQRKKERKLMYEARQKELENSTQKQDDEEHTDFSENKQEETKLFENETEKCNLSNEVSNENLNKSKQISNNEADTMSSSSESEDDSDNSSISKEKNSEDEETIIIPQRKNVKIVQNSKVATTKESSTNIKIESKDQNVKRSESPLSNFKENKAELINNTEKVNSKTALSNKYVSDLELLNPSTVKPKKSKRNDQNIDNVKNKRSKPSPSVKSVSNSIAEIKPFSQMLNEKKVKLNHEETNDPKDDTNTNKLEKSVDEFFFRAQGNEEYLSIATKGNYENKKTQVQRHYNDNLNRKQRRQKDRYGYVKDVNIKKKGSQNSSFSSKSFINTENKKSTVDHTKEQKEENLHPSWAAKKQMNPTIVAFEGKKIVFD